MHTLAGKTLESAHQKQSDTAMQSPIDMPGSHAQLHLKRWTAVAAGACSDRANDLKKRFS